MYFSMFPQMLYTLDDYSSGQLVTDITRRVKLSDELKNNTAFFDLYDVVDGETPEHIADKVYGDSQYHWVVLLTNEIIDPRYDWPLTQPDLVDYCKSKYGSANVYATHHYIDANGYTVNSTEAGATSVSNFTYEDGVNETKRRIKLLKPEVVSEVVSNFEELVNR